MSVACSNQVCPNEQFSLHVPPNSFIRPGKLYLSYSPPGFLETEARQRCLDRLGTTLQTLSFRVGHLGFEHPMHAVPANDARQGKRNAEGWVVIADRNHRP